MNKIYLISGNNAPKKERKHISNNVILMHKTRMIECIYVSAVCVSVRDAVSRRLQPECAH